VQELAATIGYAAAKRLRPTRHVFGAVLWYARVTAIKICMLVATVALQWPQVLDQQFVGSPELRWLLDRQTALWPNHSRHALVDLCPNDLRK